MEIRKATIDDSAAIARCVMGHMDFDVFRENLESEVQLMLTLQTE